MASTSASPSTSIWTIIAVFIRNRSPQHFTDLEKIVLVRATQTHRASRTSTRIASKPPEKQGFSEDCGGRVRFYFVRKMNDLGGVF
jgi:hypothetical protein